MNKAKPAESPAAYVAALDGWRKSLVQALRRATRAAGELDEQVKWGHLAYSSNGPVLLIRAEEKRVLFGFWRGRRRCKSVSVPRSPARRRFGKSFT
jgi:hypothetical protein